MPWENDELVTAWKALSAKEVHDDKRLGWHSIPLSISGNMLVHAGKRIPGHEEGIILGFNQFDGWSSEQFPESQGFHIRKLEFNGGNKNCNWIGMWRSSNASLELFTRVVTDIVSTLLNIQNEDPNKKFKAFIARIHAWQYFMQKNGNPLLSPEEELGLFGETELIRDPSVSGQNVG